MKPKQPISAPLLLIRFHAQSSRNDGKAIHSDRFILRNMQKGCTTEQKRNLLEARQMVAMPMEATGIFAYMEAKKPGGATCIVILPAIVLLVSSAKIELILSSTKVTKPPSIEDIRTPILDPRYTWLR